MSSILKDNWIFNSLFSQLTTGKKRQTIHNHAQLLVILYNKPHKDIEVVLSDKQNTIIAELTQNAVTTYHQSFDHAFTDIKGCFVRIKRYAFVFCTSRKKFVMKVDLFKYEGNESEVVGNPSDVNLMSSIKEYTFMGVFDRMRYDDVVGVGWNDVIGGLGGERKEYVEWLVGSNGLVVDGNDCCGEMVKHQSAVDPKTENMDGINDDVNGINDDVDGFNNQGNDLINNVDDINNQGNDFNNQSNNLTGQRNVLINNENISISQGNVLINNENNLIKALDQITSEIKNDSKTPLNHTQAIQNSKNVKSYNRLKHSFHGSKVNEKVIDFITKTELHEDEHVDEHVKTGGNVDKHFKTVDNVNEHLNNNNLNNNLNDSLNNNLNISLNSKYINTYVMPDLTAQQNNKDEQIAIDQNKWMNTYIKDSHAHVDNKDIHQPQNVNFNNQTNNTPLIHTVQPTITNVPIPEEKIAVFERIDHLQLDILNQSTFDDQNFTLIDEQSCTGTLQFISEVALRARQSKEPDDENECGWFNGDASVVQCVNGNDGLERNRNAGGVRFVSNEGLDNEGMVKDEGIGKKIGNDNDMNKEIDNNKDEGIDDKDEGIDDKNEEIDNNTAITPSTANKHVLNHKLEQNSKTNECSSISTAKCQRDFLTDVSNTTRTEPLVPKHYVINKVNDCLLMDGNERKEWEVDGCRGGDYEGDKEQGDNERDSEEDKGCVNKTYFNRTLPGEKKHRILIGDNLFYLVDDVLPEEWGVKEEGKKEEESRKEESRTRTVKVMEGLDKCEEKENVQKSMMSKNGLKEEMAIEEGKNEGMVKEEESKEEEGKEEEGKEEESKEESNKIHGKKNVKSNKIRGNKNVKSNKRRNTPRSSTSKEKEQQAIGQINDRSKIKSAQKGVSKRMKRIKLVKKVRPSPNTSYTLFATENTENGDEEATRENFINTVLANEIAQGSKNVCYRRIKTKEGARENDQPYTIVKINSFVHTEDGRADQVIFTVKDYKLDEW